MSKTTKKRQQRRGIMPRPINGIRTFRAGNLVVRLSENMISFRGFRKHKWHSLTIERIASMLDDRESLPMLTAIEESCGKRVLSEIGATGV